MNKDPHLEEERENPDVSYERSDARAKPIIYFGIGLCVLAVVVHATLWVFLKALHYIDAGAQKSQFIVKDDRWQSPPVQLEVRPGDQRRIYIKEQQELLTSYGWIDPVQQIARVPVERAMQLALQQGFPVRDKAPENTQKYFIPSESGGPVNTADYIQNPHVSTITDK